MNIGPIESVEDDNDLSKGEQSSEAGSFDEKPTPSAGVNMIDLDAFDDSLDGPKVMHATSPKSEEDKEGEPGETIEI